MKQKYETDIELGEKYRDTQTGIQGTATAITFYQHGCERANIETVASDGKIVDYGFDAPRLTHLSSGRTAQTTRTGGPGRTASGTDPAARR